MPTSMTEEERKVYKKKMKAIKAALEAGDEAEADRIANELMDYLGVP